MNRFLACLFFALLASSAHAQPSALILNRILIDNQYYIGENASNPTTLSPRELNAAHPSIIGLGRDVSVVKHNGTGTRIVTTENYASVTQDVANFMDATIDGNAGVPDSCFNDDDEWGLDESIAGRLVDGFSPKATLTTLSRAKITDVRGYAVSVQGGDGHIFSDLDILSVWTGVVLNGDQGIINSQIVNCRDAGIHAVATTGNNWSSGNHVFGAYIACLNLSDGFRSTGDVFADCFLGYYAYPDFGARATITGTRFQYCKHRAIVCLATDQKFLNCFIQQPPYVALFTADHLSGNPVYDGSVGWDVQAARCEFRGGEIFLDDASHGGTATAGGVGVKLNGSAVSTRIYTTIREDDGEEGSVGIQITGTPADVRGEVQIAGLDGTNDKVLTIADAGMKGLNLTLFVTDEQYDSPSDDFTVPSDWDETRAANNNVVTLIKASTGASKVLTE